MTQYCPRCGFETDNTIPDPPYREEGSICNNCLAELSEEEQNND